MPCLLAQSSPAASDRLLMTCVTSPAMRPSRAASISAAMFEPRPEIRMVMRASDTFIARRERRASTLHDHGGRGAVGAGNDLPDVERALARDVQRVDRPADLVRGEGEHHADAAIEDAMHLVVGDGAVTLQP